MQPKSPTETTRDQKIIEPFVEDSDKLNIRIGAYYTKLKTNQKNRFGSIERSIKSKLELTNRNNPMEMILVRQIALNTIRIEEAELDFMDAKKEFKCEGCGKITTREDKYKATVDKWIFSAQKERRDAMTTLTTILKIETKKGGVNNFLDMRNALREGENLDKTEEAEVPEDGHERRYHDPITRTTE